MLHKLPLLKPDKVDIGRDQRHVAVCEDGVESVPVHCTKVVTNDATRAIGCTLDNVLAGLIAGAPYEFGIPARLSSQYRRDSHRSRNGL